MGIFYTSVELHFNDILVRGYKDKKPFAKKIAYKPFLFMGDNQESEYHTVGGQPVKRFDFKNIKAAREYVKQHENIEGVSLYGMNRFVYPFIFDHFPGEIEYDVNLIRVANIDIEVASDKGFPSIEDALHEITAITIKQGDLFYAFGCGEFKEPSTNVCYFKCDSEVQLLARFLELWNNLAPDVMTGWNIETFDIPYLVNRITRLLGQDEAERLSPWRQLRQRTIQIHKRDNIIFQPVGIQVLDYLALYKKFTQGQQESFRLDNIASVELGERKTDYSQYGSLIRLYRENFQLFMEYNIRDVELVDRIDKKKRLLNLVYSIAYDSKVNMEDALTSVGLWDVVIHNYLLEQKIVVPFHDKNEWREFVGAFVKEPKVGGYNWVVSFDLTSLYPHLIMQYNISPETFKGNLKDIRDINLSLDDVINEGLTDYRDYLIEKNYSCAANLCVYSKHTYGFMPKLMERLFQKRKASKDKKLELEAEYLKTNDTSLPDRIDALEVRQSSIKVILNALYGVLGNKYFRWYKVDHAEAITWSGQHVIQKSAKNLNAYLNGVLKTEDKDFIIAMDTDSLYVNLEPLVKAVIPNETDKLKIVNFIDKVCKSKLDPFLRQTCEDLAQYMNAYANRMSFKREVIAERGIWTGKKHYTLAMWDKEGIRYDKPKTKVVGIESVRSTTPKICRDAIKSTIDLILSGTEDQVQQYIDEFRKKYMTCSLSDIAIPVGVNNLEKFRNDLMIYNKSTPQHVKGALLYNFYHQRKKVQDHPLIYDGDKIKMYCLRKPNPIRDEVISVPTYIPAEFKLEQYVDRNAMFNRSYLDPVKAILNVIGWKDKKENTLF